MKSSVLVVEPDLQFQPVLKKYLERLGYAVQAVVSTSIEGLRAAEAGGVDLALVAVGDGAGSTDVQLAAVLNGRFRIPTVLLSSHAGRSSPEGIARSGAMSVVVKPFLVEQLGAALEVTLIRHRLERRVEHQRDWFHAVLSGLAEGVVVIDSSGCVSFVNHAAARLLGAEVRALLEHPVAEVLAPILRSAGDPAAALVETRIRDGQPFDKLRFAIWAGGQRQILEASQSPPDDSGYGGTVLTIGDVTARERQAEALRLTVRLQSAVSLASGVAHHMNGMLQVVMGHAELLLREAPAEGGVRRSATAILRTAMEHADLVSQLRRFSREENRPREVVAVQDILDDLSTLAHAMLPSNIRVEVEPLLPAAKVMIQRSDVLSALAHLIDSAHRAMPQGGVLSLAARVRTSGSREERKVEICFADTRDGMTEEARLRAFDPFGLGTSPGTELGMANVLRTAQVHGGTAEIEAAPGRATIVRIVLPLVADEGSPEEAGDRTSGRPDTSNLRGNETILVVDDEPGILVALGTMLEDLGYSIRSAGSAPEALAILSDPAHAVHLMITDVMMPGMNGWELARRAEEGRPGLRVIVLSGYAPEELPDLDGHANRKYPRLDKPAPIKDIARLVRNLLDSPVS